MIRLPPQPNGNLDRVSASILEPEVPPEAIWKHNEQVGAACDYAREKAPRDVLDFLDWLVGADFALAGERGGPGESFGNVLLTFERSRLAIRITRNRGQWMMEVAPSRSEFVPLHVLLTARDGSKPAPRARSFVEQLPEVI